VVHPQEISKVKKNQKGFSLIELLIVVAIILIIAAIAIPNLLRSRMAANEASAVGSLRTINTACVTYQTTYQSQGFPTSLAQLGPAATATSSSADLVDSVLAAGTKSGYTFTLAQVGSGTPSTGYSVSSKPQNPQVTGVRGFYTDQSGVIRADTSGTASSTSSPLQ
jgi:prepilin-type N-terminal cleavage/methylation domain-containing protein